MTNILIYMYVLTIILVTVHHSLGSPITRDIKDYSTTEFATTNVASSLPPSQSERNPSPAGTTETPFKGGLSHEDDLMFTHSHENFHVSPNQKPISSIKPTESHGSTSDNDDVQVPVPSQFVPVVIAYPLRNGDMALAESNIVFRPLFSYRRSSSEKRRVYSYEPSSTFRASRGRYPDFYNNAPYDNVP